MNGKAQFTLLTILLIAAASTPAQERFSFFQASTPESVERMLTLAELRDDDVVVDLGSGDGLIPLTAARMNKRLRGWGVDIDQKLVEQSNQRASDRGRRRSRPLRTPQCVRRRSARRDRGDDVAVPGADATASSGDPRAGTPRHSRADEHVGSRFLEAGQGEHRGLGDLLVDRAGARRREAGSGSWRSQAGSTRMPRSSNSSFRSSRASRVPAIAARSWTPPRCAARTSDST